MATVVAKAPVDDRIVSKERLMGDAKRWRRFGAPVAAGGSRKADGTPDFGLFEPGSIVWEVVLHPSTIFLQTIVQQMLQTTYKPVHAGLRDVDPISTRAQAGKLTVFDSFNRAQRNSGVHVPMWLGDTDTAKRVAQHLHNIHAKVRGVIDSGHPELGDYAANSPRDAMWAALTEMHSLLWLYEGFAWRGGLPPRRLPAAVRDRFIAESAAYVQLFDPPAGETPHTMAQLKALYQKYAPLFGTSETMDIIPGTDTNYRKLMIRNMKENFHRSQWRVLGIMILQYGLFMLPVYGAVSAPTRRSKGLSPAKDLMARIARPLSLPLVWLLTRGPFERYFMRLLWGPDGVELIRSARRLHRQAKRAGRRPLAVAA